MQNRWHYRNEANGKRLRPDDRDAIGQLVEAEHIDRMTLVRNSEMPGWAKASTTDLVGLGLPPLPADETNRWTTYALALFPLWILAVASTSFIDPLLLNPNAALIFQPDKWFDAIARLLRTSATGRSRVMVCIALALGTSGCSRTSPECSAQEVKTSIEQDARASIDLWLGTMMNTTLPADTTVVISETYQTARQENIRSCAATITVGSAKGSSSAPIEYDVIRADDGQVLYRWEKDTFGKAFIASAMMSELSKQTPQTALPPVSTDGAVH